MFSLFDWKHSPKRNAVLRVIEALNSSEEQRQRVRRVAADQCDDDPRSEERRLGAPALLGEISPARGQQKKGQQDKQKRADRVHGRGEKLGGDEAQIRERRMQNSENPAVVLCRHWLHGGVSGSIKGVGSFPHQSSANQSQP